MTVNAHAAAFLHKKVENFNPDNGIANPEQIVYRIMMDYDEGQITQKIEAFLKDPKVGQVRELIIGAYDFQGDESMADIIQQLAEAKDILSSLKALFLGDIIYEESEISWIQQTDISPILKAYPQLEHLQVRGGDGLTFSDLKHDNLRTLIIETGGLPPNVITQVMESRLPQLERLELWLGSDNYGFDSKIEDFAPIFAGTNFPELRHLGLMNSEIQDDIAKAVAEAPILRQLKVLDLSMGTLSDAGGQALLDSKTILRLDFLNLRRHYLSDDMMGKLKRLGIRINMDDQEKSEDEDDRYAEVTE